MADDAAPICLTEIIEHLLSYECSTIAKLAQEIEDVQTMRQQLKTTTDSPLDETDETEEFRL